MHQYTIALLGSFQVQTEEKILVDGGFSKPWALFAYLLVERGRAHSREHLAALFWPDQPDTNARQSLRWALTTLRRAIGDNDNKMPLVLVSRESLQFNLASAANVDLIRLDELLADPNDQQKLCQAIDLYRGELLAGASLPDAEPFEEWLQQTRLQLQQQLSEALNSVIAGATASQNSSSLEHYAQRWLQIEPWNEIAHRACMQALVWAGKRTAALQQYEQCRRILAEELGIEPEDATQALAERIRSGAESAVDAAQSQLVSIHSPAEEPIRKLDDDRSRMIERVKRFWVDGLLNPAQDELFIQHLPLEVKPGSGHPLPMSADRAQTTISAIFDSYRQDLLIRGAPGAGKTYLLVELAQELLERATRDPAAPIPVILNLAFWDKTQSPFQVWIQRELQLRYQVPARLAQSWLEEGMVLPLLDGFDEIQPIDYAACVAEIRQFRSGMVICCRDGEAENLEEALAICGLVQILPLEAVLVTEVLNNLPNGTRLQELFQSDPSWYDLARTPLALSLLHGAFRKASDEQVFQLDAQVQDQLFGAYVRAMFERSGGQRFANADRQQRWLAWLADMMLRHKLSIFSLEALQVSWLSERWQVKLFLALENLILALFFGLIVAADESSRVGMGAGRQIAGWAFLNGLGSAAVVGGVVSLLAISLPAPKLANWPRLRRGLQIGGLSGFVYGLSLALLQSQGQGLLIGSTVGICLFMIGYLIDPERLLIPLDSFYWSNELALRRLPIALSASLVSALLFVYLGGWLSGGAIGIAVLIVVWLGGGLTSASLKQQLQPGHFLLRAARTAWQASLLVGSLIVGTVVLAATFFSLLLRVTAYDQELGLQYTFLELAGDTTGILLLGMGLAALCFGALSCLQHLLLRILIWRADQFPFRMVTFLDQVSHLAIVRRVGTGYMFMHRLLEEYCARINKTNIGNKK
jgi:DNA-binding SARP family transcriptional activator